MKRARSNEITYRDLVILGKAANELDRMGSTELSSQVQNVLDKLRSNRQVLAASGMITIGRLGPGKLLWLI